MKSDGHEVPAGQYRAHAGSWRPHDAAIVHSAALRSTAPVVDTNIAAS